MTPKTLQHFFDKTGADAKTGCWIWQGALHGDGYGEFWSDGRLQKSHRVAHEHFVGPIPDGMTVDHLCRNRQCVNPGHLEAVTIRENILRGDGRAAMNARKTHCIRGHPLSGDNLRVDTKGHRHCRACCQVWNRMRGGKSKTTKQKGNA